MINDPRAACSNLAKDIVCDVRGCAHDTEECARFAHQIALRDKWFFASDVSGHQSIRGLNNALNVCVTCPITEACLEHAAESPHSWEFGVFGATLQSERSLLDGRPNLSAAHEIRKKRLEEADE